MTDQNKCILIFLQVTFQPCNMLGIQIVCRLVKQKDLRFLKKKLRQQEKEAAEKAAREYAAKKNPELEKEEKKPLSGIAERPYCRGRAYQADHYGKRKGAQDAASGNEE